VPPAAAAVVQAELARLVPLHRIGVIEQSAGVRCMRDGRPQEVGGGGYDHFA
jgi:thiamine monophosphate kinase